MKYKYFINQDERGEFSADVRVTVGQFPRMREKTVFEFCSDQKTGEIPVIDDGYMRHKTDLAGLRDYLIELGVMTNKDDLVSGN